MRRWITTGLVVAALAILAATAGTWVPALLTLVLDPGQNAALIQTVTAAVMVGLWMLTALVGAVALKRAIDAAEARRTTKREAGQAGQTPAAAAEATTAAPEGATSKRARRRRANGNGHNGHGTEPQPATAAGKARMAVEMDRAAAGNGGDPAHAPIEEQIVELRTPGGVRILAEGSTLELEGEPDQAWLAPMAEALDEPIARSLDQPVAVEMSSPQPAPVITTPFNLPADLADFTGRSAEIAALRRHLGRAGSAAVSTIAGMGGIGKTCLALHVAHQLAADGGHPDGQLYIDLKGTEPVPLGPVAALNTLITALQGPDAARAQDEGSLAAAWRAALEDKRVLLVFDNAANAAQVEPLLPGSPGSAVLITSRQRFTVGDSTLVDLTRLKPEEARELLRHLAPDLDAAAADQIAELCGGLPLALRIAGNYLALNSGLAAGEYAERLSDERQRLAQLRDPSNPNLDVSAALSLSVSQLDAGTHWAWHLLALFAAPFDSAAASALWGEGVRRDAWEALDDETTVRWLSALHNRSLVSFDQATGRYHLHDLLRLSASGDLGQNKEVQEAQARLAYHYLEVIQHVNERQRYLDLDPDWPQLQATLKFVRRDVALFSDLVLALNDYWSARGMARECADWSRRAAKACAETRRRREQGIHLGYLGSAYADRGDARRAIEYYGQALTLGRGSGDRRLEATLLGNLGRAYAALGEVQRAIHYHEQALDIVRQVGDQRGQGNQLGDLGSALVALGEPRKAIEHLVQGLAIARDLKDQRMQGTLLSSLGLAYATLGDTHQAVECQKQALAIHREVGDRRGEAAALDNLGLAYAEMGQAQRAVDYYEQALEITQTIGDRRSEGSDLGNLGQAYADMGDARRAIQYYGQALAITQEVGDRRSEGACLGNRGRACLQLGDVHGAIDNFQQALEIAQQVGDRRGEANWLGNLGQAHARLGEVDQAMAYHEQAVSIYQEVGDRRSEGNYLASLGMLARMQGDADRAHEVWLGAFQTLEALKDPNAGQVWQWLAELEGQNS